MAFMMATRIVGPNLWGWLADKTQQRIVIVRWGVVAAIVGFLPIFFDLSYWPLILALAVYSFFWNAVLPQVEVITIHFLADKADYYGRIRLWGSIGFVLFVTVCGWLFDYISITWVPVFMFGLMVAILFSTLTFSEPPSEEKKEKGSIRPLLFSLPVLSFLLVGMLMHTSHGPLYYFYSIFLEQSGYSKAAIGGLWSVGVIAEIVLFIYMHRLIAWLGPRRMLLLSIVLAAVRWIIIGSWVDSIALMFVAQLMHAATFGIFHSVSMHYVHAFFGKEHAGQGQSFYSSICYGVGGVIGAWYSGEVWQHFGPEVCFYTATIVNLLALLVFMVGMSKADQIRR